MFKLPSLRTVTDELAATITRFQWVSIAAICKTAVLIRMSEAGSNEVERDFMTRLSYPAFLAVPLFFAVQLVSERKNWPVKKRLLVNAAILLVLILYYFLLPDKTGTSDFYRFMLFMVSAHLIAAFVPFFGKGEINGFWQYNKTLFLQFLNATLYSITLFIGLWIALYTIRFLFGIEFLFNAELDLFTVISVLFHTLFFLSKIPQDVDNLQEETGFPTGLKIFTQYVLLPLEVVYMLILYAYTFKIIFEWRLPDGGVAYLVMAFSIAGILALLLLHPLRENLNEKWVRLFSRRFYFALLPLIVLLFIGIFRRIHDYGITENRYIIAVLACWLAVATLYFIFSKKSDIRWIPASLAALAILVAVGPWNIFVIARKSQASLFAEILREYKLLDSKNHISGKATLPQKDYDRLTSIIEFFNRRKQPGLEAYFADLKIKDTDSWNYYNQMGETLSKHIKTGELDPSYNGRFSSFWALENASEYVEIDSLSRLHFFRAYEQRDLLNERYRIENKMNSGILTLYENDKKLAAWNLFTRVNQLKSQYGGSSPVPARLLTFQYVDKDRKVVIIFHTLSKHANGFDGEGVILYR